MANGTCTVEDCGRTGPVKRSWCHGHYMRWRRHGDVQAHIPLRPILPPRSLCTVKDCGRPYFSNRYCSAHWSRWRQYGDPLAHIPIRQSVPRRDTCSIEDCGQKPRTRGWCSKHYMCWWLHGDPLKRDGRLRAEGAPSTCAVDTCDEPIQSLGWCRTHYSRWQRRGDVWAHIPIRRHRWAGQACGSDGCAKHAQSRGLCKFHYAQVLTSEVKTDPVRMAARREASRRHRTLAFAINPAKARTYARAWRVKNPAAARLNDHRKRLRKLAAPTLAFTADQFNQRMAYWGNCCWMCGGPFEAVDHVKPISRGGAHALMNVRPSCRSHNSSKKDRWPFPTRVALHIIPLL
jgi:hypothetical protein